MTEKIEREKLYEQVWTTPLTILCRSYGLSYPGLRKLCGELNVPTPKRGHWAKVAAGGRVKKPALPPVGGAETLAAAKPRANPRPAAEQKKATSPANDQKLPDPLDAPLHPLIRPVAKDFLDDEKRALQLKGKFDWEQAHPGRRYGGPEPKLNFGSWETFCEKGQILCTTHEKSVLRVSLKTFRRALQLLSHLAVRFETSGFRLQISQQRKWLEASRDGARITFRISEKMNATSRITTPSWSSTPTERRFFNPTGRLSIFIGHQGFGEIPLSDRPGDPLEANWEKTLAVAELQFQKALEIVARWARQELEAEEAARVRRNDELRREETKRGEEAEALKRQALLQEAKDWQSAETLRTYLDALERRIESGGIPAADYTEWKAWARGVAEDLDKSRLRISEAPAALDSILGRKDSN